MLPELDSVTRFFSLLPGIGYKSAMRIAFHLLKQDQEQLNYFADTLRSIHKSVGLCTKCGSVKAAETDCRFCEVSSRDDTLICVVEEPSDVFLIENSGEFSGLYHVLMGVLSPLDGVGPKDIRLDELKNRLQENTKLEEIIVATNPTIEGNATANYIAELAVSVKPVKVSRIASGLAAGSYLDYADSQVISQSLKGRILI